jgi:hypothetical protein
MIRLRLSQVPAIRIRDDQRTSATGSDPSKYRWLK